MPAKNIARPASSRPKHFSKSHNKRKRKAISITITERRNDFHACLSSDRAVWGRGKNSYEAIGDLIMHHEEVFGIEIASRIGLISEIFYS